MSIFAVVGVGVIAAITISRPWPNSTYLLLAQNPRQSLRRGLMARRKVCHIQQETRLFGRVKAYFGLDVLVVVYRSQSRGQSNRGLLEYLLSVLRPTSQMCLVRVQQVPKVPTPDR